MRDIKPENKSRNVLCKMKFPLLWRILNKELSSPCHCLTLPWSNKILLGFLESFIRKRHRHNRGALEFLTSGNMQKREILICNCLKLNCNKFQVWAESWGITWARGRPRVKHKLFSNLQFSEIIPNWSWQDTRSILPESEMLHLVQGETRTLKFSPPCCYLIVKTINHLLISIPAWLGMLKQY